MTIPAGPAVPPDRRHPLAQEREAAVARVREAYAAELVSHDELDERLHAVLTASTSSEVALAVASLPAAAEPRALVIDAVNGRIRREGRWRVPRTVRISSEYGKVRLDLSEAVFESPVVDVELELTYGRARIVVPRDAVVDLDGLRADWKQPRYDARRASGAGGPIVRITGHLEYGRLTVKHAGR